MSLKKGLKFIAYGYLFILLNYNLSIGEISINIIPSFIGSGLIFIGLRMLGDYTINNIVLYILNITIGTEQLVSWIIFLTGYQMSVLIEIIFFAVNLIFMYLLFTVLIKIAEDYNSFEVRKLSMLRITYIVFSIVYYIFGCAFYFNQKAIYYAWIAFALGVICFFVGVGIAISLFRLSKM